MLNIQINKPITALVPTLWLVFVSYQNTAVTRDSCYKGGASCRQCTICREREVKEMALQHKNRLYTFVLAVSVPWK